MYTLREYQAHALEALRAYFRTCSQLSASGMTEAANLAFYQRTLETFGVGIPYRPISELQGLPYVCLRLPTGGGKTYLACHAVHVAVRDLLRADQCVVLWLVPSNAIREQTLKALQDRQHPYRRTLEETLGSVSVLDIAEALYVTRATLNTSTTFVVSTIQAFRVEETEGRKVYESSGALMEHFEGYPAHVLAGLEQGAGDAPAYSLANVLKLRRPVVIVDEAHNARTELSFSTLARFSPSCIIEFTATPDSDRNPSNVLYSVSAAELKAEDMIKMPILLETRPNWRELLSDAIERLNQLEAEARAEGRLSGEYVRPIMLLQAQPRRGGDAITVDVVRQCLIDDFGVPEAQIARATGEYKELDEQDISAVDCPIRYVITVYALREGWDCPFAYVLCSVAEMTSGTAVEQILGRVMRLPHVRRKQHEALNLAYAYAASSNFGEVAQSLVDGLVQNGFERVEARDMIVQPEQQALDLSDLPLFNQTPPAVVIATEGDVPRIETLPPETAAKVSLGADGMLTVKESLDDLDLEALRACYRTEAGKRAVDRAMAHAMAPYTLGPPAERGEPFSIPVLAYRQGELPLEPFEETHFRRMLDLSRRNAALSESEYPAAGPQALQAQIDVGKGSRIQVAFVSELHQQMQLLASDLGWEAVDLIYWLDRTLPRHPTVAHSESSAFVNALVHKLLDERGFSLAQLVHDKYRLRAAVARKIEDHLQAARDEAYQPFLDLDTSPLTVTPECCFTFDSQRYPYNRPYRGRHEFARHYYRELGDFDNGEEERCAVYIDRQPNVAFWVRNPPKGSKAFWLQTRTDKFYPDFICQLQNGRYLVVEYKGADRWSNDDSREKRQLGALWERRSNGACFFVMPKGADLEAIGLKIAEAVG